MSDPYQRGDDVAQLQVHLAQLGFNPGRIDGIFGPLLDRALREFQENAGLDVNGVLTRATIHALERLGGNEERRLVTDARNLEEQNGGRAIVLWGDGPLVSELARALRTNFEVHQSSAANAHDVAAFANEHQVALVLSLATLESMTGIHLHYWAGYRTHSRRGEQLASAIAATLAASASAPRVEVTGMALPVLRETQMTTLHVEFGKTSDQGRHGVVTAIATNVERVIHSYRKK
ncbi:MAG TPA: peptidoglycan-binding domain-containing protein [Acidimicrobiales bacterium]